MQNMSIKGTGMSMMIMRHLDMVVVLVVMRMSIGETNHHYVDTRIGQVQRQYHFKLKS